MKAKNMLIAASGFVKFILRVLSKNHCNQKVWNNGKKTEGGHLSVSCTFSMNFSKEVVWEEI
jgi:hypothetical protein